MIAIASFFIGSLAHAADTEDSKETDKSHNPITGTDTETTTVKKKEAADDKGKVHETKMKKKVKHMKSGKIEKSTTKEESEIPTK
jgi:hypothetical protein